MRQTHLHLPVLLAGLGLAASSGGARAAPTVTSLVNGFAQYAIANGQTPGVEVAVVTGGGNPQYFSFGTTHAGLALPPTKDTLFEIASVTKVFTTNLQGQAYLAGTFPLTETLKSFEPILGTLPPATAAVTLEQLGDFTGGFPSLPALCSKTGSTPPQTGCLPTLAPPITSYTAEDMAAFFRTYTLPGALPYPYIYSDFSIGLLGLLLGAPAGKPIENVALTGYEKLLTGQLLQPLHLSSTFFTVPAKSQALIATGYAPAIAEVSVTAQGEIGGFTIANPGAGYSKAPRVTISDGGGSGATATAVLNSAGAVSSIVLTNAGSGYTPPPSVTVSGGGATVAAKLKAIVAGGAVIGVAVVSGGSGYVRVPKITFSGGRGSDGSDATGTAVINNGVLTYVKIDGPGSGYVDPPRLVMTPAVAALDVVRIWAPAGGLKSSIADVAHFAAAAAGNTSVAGLAVPSSITNAFAVAEMPYACEGASPALAGCTSNESGLAWDIVPGTPTLVEKDGGLPGFGSLVIVDPADKAAVVVLTNSWSNSSSPAPQIAREIMNALIAEGLAR